MTLPPERIGDKGQRYEVRATGYPKAGENVIGWSATKEGAKQMADAIRHAPSCTSTTVYDRELNTNVITSYGGILR
jgi:hypothetical protein